MLAKTKSAIRHLNCEICYSFVDRLHKCDYSQCVAYSDFLHDLTSLICLNING